MQRIAGLASLVTLAAAHGFIKSPPPREPGDAFKATCGEQPYYQQSSDINGNVQGIFQVVGDDTTDDCKLWLCKGFLLEDNEVQSYSLGETIDFEITIAAPHTGYANVSVVKTSTDSIIGSPLIEFQNYAANAGVDANNTAFSITLPDSLDGDCTSAGDCVLQWFWDAPDIDQTYESCVDFTVDGSGSDQGSDDDSEGTDPSTSVPATSSSEAASAPTADTSANATSGNATPTASETPSSPSPTVSGDESAKEGEDEDDVENPSQGNQQNNSSSDSNSTLPETFTLDTFIEWLKETAGASTKARRHTRDVRM